MSYQSFFILMSTAQVTVAIDLGASLTKIVFARDSTEPQFLALHPEASFHSQDEISDYLASRSFAAASPLQDLYVYLNQDDDNACVVGRLAQQLHNQTNLKILKYELALYKVLGVLGYLSEVCSGAFNLAILLPWSECHDREKLEKNIRAAVRRFWWKGQVKKLKLNSFKAMPEGAGIALHRNRGKNCSVLMFGHRNTSFLQFEAGSVVQADTTDKGFNLLVDKVITQTSGQNSRELTPMIYQLGNPDYKASIDPEDSLIKALCKSQLPENRKSESQEIAQAITKAKSSYWNLLKKWLDVNNATECTGEIIFAGGAARFLRTELSDYFKPNTVYWGMDLSSTVARLPGFDEFKKTSELPYGETLAYRFIDAYILYDLMHYSVKMASEKQSKQRIRSQKVGVTD